ncbi:MAG TPA: hypothetical protein VGR02_00425 [Thermoanaerobaculia bacterium]|jgi:hypothetical protein|nr:hypothetical protein [Thermoanaerobaculia bacterium]
MLKPVTILALDQAAASLAAAVQQRVAAACGLDDLVQMRAIFSEPLAEAVASVHARRQAPDSPLRARDDIKTRELVLLVTSATSGKVLEVARQVRELYDMRRLAAYFTVEILCLLPDLFAGADYGAAYSLLKLASAARPRPFDVFWLLDAMNASRVRFGHLEQSQDAYAQAVAGAVLLEPEMSGAPAGRRPRGMDPTFSSFGCAELFFPRDVAAQRLETRFASELVRGKLLAAGAAPQPQLAARQFVVGEAFALPLSRIGLDAGRSLFQRFQARTRVTEHTRTAEEVIAAVRHELMVHRDTTHAQNLQTLHAQSEQTTTEFATLLGRTVNESLDRDGYAAAIRLVEALVDPLPDLHAETDVAPRNLVTEINAATAALDARLRFTPNTAASDAGRKRARELDHLVVEQKPIAGVLDAQSAPEQLAALEEERDELARRLPELLFAEETANNTARHAARDAEAARLAGETEAAEQRLRELFARRPRAEQALREALEARRAFLWRTILWAAFGFAAVYGVPFAFGVLGPNLERIHWTAAMALGLFALYSAVRYVRDIAPPIRLAREELERIRVQIELTDRAKNTAHQEELQFECDMAHRRATLRVLHDTRNAAKQMLDALRARTVELEQFALSLAPPSIQSDHLSIAILDDADVDRWFERTSEDRKPLFREFFETCVSRSQSLRLSLEELRQRVTAFAARAIDPFRKLTIAHAAQLSGDAGQRLKRLADHSAPLVDLRDDDPEAQLAMQRDATLWADPSDAAFAAQLQRRFPDAHREPAADPLRIQVFTRVLHYPAYILGQLDYYRSQYDPSRHAESAAAPDLLPAKPIASNPEETFL